MGPRRTRCAFLEVPRIEEDDRRAESVDDQPGMGRGVGVESDLVPPSHPLHVTQLEILRPRGPPESTARARAPPPTGCHATRPDRSRHHREQGQPALRSAHPPDPEQGGAIEEPDSGDDQHHALRRDGQIAHDPVKKKSTAPIVAAAISPAIRVLPPMASSTAVRESAPETAKLCERPEAI